MNLLDGQFTSDLAEWFRRGAPTKATSDAVVAEIGGRHITLDELGFLLETISTYLRGKMLDTATKHTQPVMDVGTFKQQMQAIYEANPGKYGWLQDIDLDAAWQGLYGGRVTSRQAIEAERINELLLELRNADMGKARLATGERLSPAKRLIYPKGRWVDEADSSGNGVPDDPEIDEDMRVEWKRLNVDEEEGGSK